MDRNVKDWGEASEVFDEICIFAAKKDLSKASEAQVRFDIIDRMIKDVLLWEHGQITVEEIDDDQKRGYVDYILRTNDYVIVIEAKKSGASFPTPTKRRKLKLAGTVLGQGEIANAILQVKEYSKNKKANLAIVTNGQCWCFFICDELELNENAYAYLAFPFDKVGDGEFLFSKLCMNSVKEGSITTLTPDAPVVPERKLLFQVKDADARVDRNNIAEYISPALDYAFYSESIINSKDQLEKCFVQTQGRTKFDSTLGIYLSDTKPSSIVPARRIKNDMLNKIVGDSAPSFAPPVTLIIGKVGAGKSTYLKHFELVSGANVIEQKRTHWIYIDFERMGKSGDPKKYMYEQLLDYLIGDHPHNPTDYKNVVEPAYAEKIAGLARGPYSLLFNNDKTEFNRKVTEIIEEDYRKVEPYVDKLLMEIGRKSVCFIILDNIDLYEDEKLETLVFSEGIALSKKIHSNVIVSIRDKTFIKHKNDALFDAYELRKLWLDPPQFKAVLAKRLTYSKVVLNKKQANISFENGMTLYIPDLSIFFDIVQRSILSGAAGDFIDAMADNNIRKGISLVINFLTSGHIQADRAMKTYIDGYHEYSFPFHEVFKGSVLGQWKFFKEDRAECINVFDSKLGFQKGKLLRLFIIKYLFAAARSDVGNEIQVESIVRIFSKLGIAEQSILKCMDDLIINGLIRSIDSNNIGPNSFVVITKTGAYYSKFLCQSFPYVEACLYDTAIDNDDAWESILSQTMIIENETSVPRRMEIRGERVLLFADYLFDIEEGIVKLLPELEQIRSLSAIKSAMKVETDNAIYKSQKYYP